MRKVSVVPYQSAWIESFEEERDQISKCAQGFYLSLHHIGSTSVPGLDAKPVIDLLMTVYDFSMEERLGEALKPLGYDALGTYGIEGRRFFIKGGDERTHHLHVFVEGDPHVFRHLAFRDFLRTHPEETKGYGDLKKALAEQHPLDIDAYCQGKRAWIAHVESEALDWLEEQARSMLEPLVSERLPLPEGDEAVALTERILPFIGSLDPELRDGMVYPVVGTLIQKHLLPDGFVPELTKKLCGDGYLLYGLGELEGESVFRRSFSLLLLTEIIGLQASNSILSVSEERELVEAMLHYFESEVDRRGYDAVFGWAHSIAHSGDAMGAMSELKLLSGDDVERMLAAISVHFSNESRVLIHEESERIVSGVLRLRAAGKLDDGMIGRWLEKLEGIPAKLPYPQKQYREENIKRLLGCLYFRLNPVTCGGMRATIEKVVKNRSHF